MAGNSTLVTVLVLCDAIAEARAALARHIKGSELSADLAIALVKAAIEKDQVRQAMGVPPGEIMAVAILQRAIGQAQNVLMEAADQARREPLSQTIVDRVSEIFDHPTVARLLALAKDYPIKGQEVPADAPHSTDRKEQTGQDN